MTAFIHAGFPADTWIQKLEDFDSGSMLGEFIDGVRVGDVDAQLISARSDTGRSAWHKNAVATWLRHTGRTDHSVLAGVVGSFEMSGKRPDKWVGELEKMQKSGELQVFLDTVSNPIWAHERVLASRRPNGNGAGKTALHDDSKLKTSADDSRNGHGSDGIPPFDTHSTHNQTKTGGDKNGKAEKRGVSLESGPLPSSFKMAAKTVIASQRLKGTPPALNQRGTMAMQKLPRSASRATPPAVTVSQDQVQQLADSELGDIDGLSSEEDDSMMDDIAALDSLMDSSDDEQSEQHSDVGAVSDEELDMLDGLDDLLDGFDDSDSD